jgi:hypothetical protein
LAYIPEIMKPELQNGGATMAHLAYIPEIMKPELQNGGATMAHVGLHS